MQQDAGSALGDLVRAAGPESLDDPRRVRAMLRDAAPEAPLEVSLLVAAVEDGVGQRLARSSAGLLDGEIERLAAGLVERRGLSPLNAGWAVRTVAWTLGRSPRPAPLTAGPNGMPGGANVPPQQRDGWTTSGGWDSGQGPWGPSAPNAPGAPGGPAPAPGPGGPGGPGPGGSWPGPSPEAPRPGGPGVPGGGGQGPHPGHPPSPWWQRPPIIAAVAAGAVVLVAIVTVVLLNQKTTQAGGTDAGGTSAGTSTSSGDSGGSTSPGSTSPGSTSPGTGPRLTIGVGPYPDEQEQILLDALPAIYADPGVCQRWIANSAGNALLTHGPLAAIACRPPAGTPTPPDTVTFVRYPSDAQSESTFTDAFPDLRDGDCVKDQPIAQTYNQGTGAAAVEAGHYGCTIDDSGAAYIAWTRTNRSIYAYAWSQAGHLDQLFTWWHSPGAAIS